MNPCKINRHVSLIKNEVYLPIALLIGIEIVVIIFGTVLINCIVLLSIIGIVYFKIRPIYQWGIYLDDKGITKIDSKGKVHLSWDNLTTVFHEITIKYHVISLVTRERTLHIPIENYDSVTLVRELMKRIPEGLLDTESAKNLGRYYYYKHEV